MVYGAGGGLVGLAEGAFCSPESLTSDEKVDRMTCMRDALKRHSRYWVYVVQRADGTYYTGSTNNLENRLKLHSAGHGAKYLRGRGPLRAPLSLCRDEAMSRRSH